VESLNKQEVMQLHEWYYDIAQGLGAEIEGTEYDELGTRPNYIHKKKSDHKKSLKALSDIVAENLGGVEPLNQDLLHPDEEAEVLYSSGDVKLLDDSIYVLKIGDVELDIGKQAEKKWQVLYDLTQGRETRESVRQRYENNSVSSSSSLKVMSQKLQNRGLPENYQQDLYNVLKDLSEDRDIILRPHNH